MSCMYHIPVVGDSQAPVAVTAHGPDTGTRQQIPCGEVERPRTSTCRFESLGSEQN